MTRPPARHAPLVLLTALLALWGPACGRPGTVDRVQPNFVDKSLFEGEWWMTQTAIDVGADVQGVTWSGDMGFADRGVDGGQSVSLARIRWVIDEDTLFAFRAYELVDGSNTAGRDPDYRGQPIAAYRIESHFDIRREYNPLTGEPLNVRVENTDDQRWYDQPYMRVDWSRNLVRSFYFASEQPVFGTYVPEDAGIDVQDGSPGVPRSYAPQFVTVGEDPGYRFADEWPAGHEDTVHYFSFVTLMNLTPGAACLTSAGVPCGVLRVPYRTAFLRVPPEHEYASAAQAHPEFDRFGTFRLMQRTYARGGLPRETLGDFCAVDADCGAGGFCDTEAQVCAGGLTPAYGETDFLTFYRPRHNLYRDPLSDQACVADWQCDGRYPSAPGVAGSVCDRAAERCSRPVFERETRRVTYHLNAGFPKHLVGAAFDVVGDWNEALMRGRRASVGAELPDYAAQAETCQTTDPTRYCYCGSAEERAGTCPGRYDPRVTPEQYAARGVANPYRCHVENTEWEEPSAPTSYEQYPLPEAYRFRFVGDECLLVLEANGCDWERTDPSVACEDVLDAEGEPVAWQMLGDLRYQFFNYVNQVNTPFGGVAAPLADPTSGELISANASFSAAGVEAAATTAIELFPALRCANARGCEPGEEGAEERYLTGENLRGYFARLGRIMHPVSVASSAGDGFSVDDPSRPALSWAGLPVDALGAVQGAMARVQDRAERLRGTDGRTQVRSDRLRSLAGTRFENGIMGALGSGGTDALQRAFDLGTLSATGTTGPTDADHLDALDPAVLDVTSPFRGNQPDVFAPDDTRQRELEQHHLCPVNAALFRSRYWEYWAEAFRGRSASEASIRMQQLTTRMVQHHQLGHGLGLRHNFAASFDRDHYGDGWFRVAFGDDATSGDELLLPRYQDFDLPGNGGDDDGFVGPGEVEAYLAELRRVRNERAARGAHNHSTSSTMDFNGDTGDAQGLGRYDVAATVWSYFDMVEGFVGDAEIASSDTSDRLRRSDVTPRTWFQSYAGGDTCRVDRDCPASAESGALAGQPITQRCVRNTREVPLQLPCAGATACVCSSFDEDFQDYVDGAAYDSDADRDGELDFTPVTYLYCSDERTHDVSWCTRFDAGESFQESIDHSRRSWLESYGPTYYRRFRTDGARTGGATGYIVDAAKIYQHLFFRLNFEPGFAANDGPLGLQDQFYASVDAMNWFTELVNLPDVGSYALNTDTQTYARISSEPDAPGADFSLLPGQGFGVYTQYQDGYFGFFRPERAGVLMDKFVALQALALRDWGLTFDPDERYFINFFDLFPIEMTELFGGLVINDPTWFAPRVSFDAGEPVIENLSWYRGTVLGDCSPAAGPALPCRASQPLTYPTPPLEGTSNALLRSWATILALAQFPVFFDTTFEQRLQIFRVGSGAGFTIPDVQQDDSTTCALGAAVPGSTHLVVDPGVLDGCDTPEDADYVIFDSRRLRVRYVAVKIRPRAAYNLEEEQLGFQLLRRAIAAQERVLALEPMGPSAALTAARQALEAEESFLEYLIDLQGRYGISNTFL